MPWKSRFHRKETCGTGCNSFVAAVDISIPPEGNPAAAAKRTGSCSAYLGSRDGFSPSTFCTWVGSFIHRYIFSMLGIFYPLPWRDSISRPIAPVTFVAGGDDITRPRRQGKHRYTLCTWVWNFICSWIWSLAISDLGKNIILVYETSYPRMYIHEWEADVGSIFLKTATITWSHAVCSRHLYGAFYPTLRWLSSDLQAWFG
jgi:hypothetical protein